MSPIPCARTKELAEVLKAGHLPSAWDNSLREHVESCRECNDFALVRESLQKARAASMQNARLASPGLLWWRAQLRRRNEAMERLSKPISIAGRFALLSTIVLALVLLLSQTQTTQWTRWFSELPSAGTLHMESLWSATSSWTVVLPLAMIGALALLGGFALYLATDKR